MSVAGEGRDQIEQICLAAMLRFSRALEALFGSLKP